jgi:hypothetical protein
VALEFPWFNAQAPQLGSKGRRRQPENSGCPCLVAASALQSLSNQSRFIFPELCLKETRFKNFHKASPVFCKPSEWSGSVGWSEHA